MSNNDKMMAGEERINIIESVSLVTACFVFLSNSDILTEISVSETTPAHNLLNINLKMMRWPAQSQLDVNMINYLVDEIKYKIPDILRKHKK